MAVLGLSLFFLITDKDSLQEELSEKELLGLAGDGITDDTIGLQKAIDETPIGETLRVPPGEYLVSRNPELTAVTGYGESYFALEVTKPITIIMDDATLKSKTDNVHGIFWIHHTSDVHLVGGSLIGDKLPENGSLVSHIAVLIQETQRSSVEGMYMKNHSQGVHLHHSDYNIVRNVTSEYNYGSGIINFASDYNLIDSCTVRNSGDGHLSLYGVGEHNEVVNCVVTEDRPGYTAEQGITVESERNSQVINNTVSGFYYGIDIKNDAQSNLIKGNEAFNNEYNIAIRPGDGGKNLLTPSHDIRIIDNIAVNPREGSPYGIYVGVGEGHQVIGNTLNEGHLIITDEEMLEEFIHQNIYVEHTQR